MRIATLCVAAHALALLACEGSISPDEGSNADDWSFDAVPGDIPGTPSDNAPMIGRDFAESDDDLLNPERGYYVGYKLTQPENAAGVRSSGHTIAISVTRLDAYRDSSLPSSFLAQLDTGFAAARAAGIKVILRFSYNSDFAPDASKARILGHIAQLAPVLARNADVIAVMQAGFIGAWGEWHGSTNGLDNPTDRKAVLDALLTALPASRGIGVRRPMFKDTAFPGGPLQADEAYSGTARARLGHHNDCFLASNSDYGTYASPVSFWQDFVADDGRFTAIGGETCALYAPRSDCAAAVQVMESGHYSYLNRQYNREVLDLWETQGCAPEVEQRLGYRFALDHVAHTEAVAPGGELGVRVDLHNSGFASPYNFRPIELVLRSASARHVVRLSNADARLWAPGAATALAVRLRIPTDIEPGSYTLSLNLPDDSDSLAGDARYAIQMANAGVFDPSTGENVISDAIVIDPSAPGPVDPEARSFVELQ